MPLVGGEVMAQLVPKQELENVVGDLRLWRAKRSVDSDVRVSPTPAADPRRPVRPHAPDRRACPLHGGQLGGGEPLCVVGFVGQQVSSRRGGAAQKWEEFSSRDSPE